MKKVLSILLSICFMLSAVYVNTAFAADTAAAGQDSEAVGLLKALEVFPQDIDLNAEITRADFSVYMARVFKVNDFDVSNTRYYLDVPMDHYALTAINYLTERGILKGDSAQIFRPDDKITVGEVCKILLSAFGCDEFAASLGGYPTGYILGARRLGVLSGNPSPEGNLTVSQAAEYIFNTIGDDFIDGIHFERNGAEGLADSSVLADYFSVYVKEGIVTAARGASMYQDKLTVADKVYVDDLKMDDPTAIMPESLIGLRVRAYYRHTKNAADNELIYVYDDTSDNDVLKIDINDFIKYSDNTLEYSDGDKTKKTGFGKIISVMYNGSPVSGNVKDVFGNLYRGTITLKKTSGGGFDLIIIENGTPFYASYISTKDETITDSALAMDANGGNKTIKAADYEIFEIFNTYGEKITIDNIKQKDIITLYEAADKHKARLVVSDKTVNGTISGVNYENGENIIKLGDAQYKMSDLSKTKSPTDIKAGNNVLLRIDSFGYAAYAETVVPGEMKPGWLVGIAVDDSGFEKTAKLRLYTSDGNLEELTVSDKVKVDGDSIDDGDKVRSAIPNYNSVNGNVKPQLIMYSLDSDKKIRKIDTTNVGTNEIAGETLAQNIKSGEVLIYADGRLGIKSALSASCIQFTVTSDSDALNANANKFAVGKPTLLERGWYNTVASYKFRGDGVYDDVLIRCAGTAEIDKESYIILVSDVSDCINDEGVETKMINGLQMGSPVSYMVADDYNIGDVAEGDIIRVGLSANMIQNHEMIYDYSVGGYPNWPGVDSERNWFKASATNYYWNAQQIIYGFVVNKKENIVEISYKNNDKIDEICNHLENVMVYDPNAKTRVYVGDISDIRDRATYGSDCSRIVFQTYEGLFRGVIVYR